ITSHPSGRKLRNQVVVLLINVFYIQYRRIFMRNPFENEDGEYLVLVNHEGQHSLWPSFREIPAGWTATGPRGARQECLDWIEANWTDMRPKSLIAAMAGSGK